MASVPPSRFSTYRLRRYIKEFRFKLAIWKYRKGVGREFEDLGCLQLDGPALDSPPEFPITKMTLRRQRQGGDVSAIFVHAGAGYHSIENETAHLQACAK